MKAVTVTYERLMNTGNWSHEKIGVTLSVEEGEKASDVLAKAKAFVDLNDRTKNSGVSTIGARKRMLEIVANPDDNTPKQVREAQSWLEANTEDGIPF